MNFSPVSWEDAIKVVAEKFPKEARDERGGASIGVIGSTRITNEEAYLLQKTARRAFGTNNIDHHRTTDYVLAHARAFGSKRSSHGWQHRRCSLRTSHLCPRQRSRQNNIRCWRGICAPMFAITAARIYLANHRQIKLRHQAKIIRSDFCRRVRRFRRVHGWRFCIVRRASRSPQRRSLQRTESAHRFWIRNCVAPPSMHWVKFGLSLPDTKFACLGRLCEFARCCRYGSLS